jgi:hypothetical protein
VYGWRNARRRFAFGVVAGINEILNYTLE